jgi:pimeloyl-ACP methyl ester carboxylesterase
MATNAYVSSDDFQLGPDIKPLLHVDNDKKGFAYSLFQRRRADGSAEIVIAFRGTEFTHANDWIFGNILGKQNPRGLRVYDTIDAKTDLPITVTGHSLGGAIAAYVSLRRAPVPTYVFNSSPRFSRNGAEPPNRRLSIVEYGEALKVGRIFGREPTQTYVSVNCTPGMNAFKGHGMRRLAICLTRMAAWHDAAARESLDLNKLAWPFGLTRPTDDDQGAVNRP